MSVCTTVGEGKAPRGVTKKELLQFARELNAQNCELSKNADERFKIRKREYGERQMELRRAWEQYRIANMVSKRCMKYHRIAGKTWSQMTKDQLYCKLILAHVDRKKTIDFLKGKVADKDLPRDEDLDLGDSPTPPEPTPEPTPDENSEDDDVAALMALSTPAPPPTTPPTPATTEPNLEKIAKDRYTKMFRAKKDLTPNDRKRLVEDAVKTYVNAKVYDEYKLSDYYKKLYDEDSLVDTLKELDNEMSGDSKFILNNKGAPGTFIWAMEGFQNGEAYNLDPIILTKA